MGARGVHFAIDDLVLAALKAEPEDSRLDFVSETIEEPWDEANLSETDSAWAYIHAGLTGTDPDGPLARVASTHPAQLAIQGEVALVDSEDGFIGLITAETVPAVAADLARIDAAMLGNKIRAAMLHYGASGDPDEAVEYASGWYPGVVDLFGRAAAAGKNIIFTVNY